MAVAARCWSLAAAKIRLGQGACGALGGQQSFC
jgi:hypothetical protein